MMERFVIVLKNEKLSSYNFIRYCIAAINFVFFILYAIFEQQGIGKISWIIVSIAIFITSITEPAIRKELFKNKITVSITYSLLFLVWIKINAWLALIHLVLLISDKIARRELQVRFFDEGIVYPSFPEKNIQWNQLQNVILKDEVLTIDFKNNKLLQAQIDINTIQPNETSFNIFCQQQLNKNKH